MLNKIFLETDGLVVGGTQLTTTGGNVNIANNVYVGGNTVTANLVVTGTFTYPAANTTLPAFSAFGNALQTVNQNVLTQIQYNTIEFDTNGGFNQTNQWMYKNGIYTPPWSWSTNVPGYYMINATVFGSTSAAPNAALSGILYKQNTPYKNSVSNFGGIAPSVEISALVFMDGKSDYLSVFATQSTNGALAIGSNNLLYSFNGCFIRPA